MRSMNAMTPTSTLYVVIQVMSGQEDTLGAFQSEQDARDAIADVQRTNRIARLFVVPTPYYPSQAG